MYDAAMAKIHIDQLLAISAYWDQQTTPGAADVAYTTKRLADKLTRWIEEDGPKE